MTSGMQVVFAAVAIVLMACGSSTTSSSEVEARQQFWGDEAVELFEAHAAAICSQDIYTIAAFYDAEVTADYRAVTLDRIPGQLREGRHEMTSFLDLCLFSPTSQINIDVVEIFLHPKGAVTIEWWTDRDSDQGTMVAALVTVGPDGIELIRYFPPIEQLTAGGDDVAADALDAPLRLLVEQHWPDQHWSGINVYGFRVADGDLDQVLLVASDSDSACPVATALWWVVDDGAVVNERRHVGVNSRACLGPEELPEGWWTGQSLPLPLDERQTATVMAGGQTIELYSSNPEREALVVWSFERFEAPGLAAPKIDQIIFEPSRLCGDFSGVAHLDAVGNTVYYCVHDIACESSSCDRFTDVAKLSMLHELAHSWLEANLDTQSRQTILDLTKTTSWHDRSAPWDQRGIEWAAEILAWGLLDRPMELLRLGFPSCDLRRTVFRVLANEEPMTPCETTPS